MNWITHVRSDYFTTTVSVVILASISILVYLPGLPGGFAFDDYHTIVNNQMLVLSRYDISSLLDAALSTDTGPFKRPLAMLSFAASRSSAGLDPASFKLANIAIHALNATLVFALFKRLTPSLCAPRAPATLVAAFATALWAVHPLNLTAVLYVVQRMTTLSTTFMLIALILYAQARCVELEGKKAPLAYWVLIPAMGVLALLVKETALLLPLYLLTLEIWVFRFRKRDNWRTCLRVILLVAVGGLLILLLVKHPLIFGNYTHREFSLPERLLTEARVLMTYLRLVLAPDLSVFGLFHDDLALSRNVFTPWTTLPALLGIGAIVTIAFRLRPPALAFACAWFLCGHLLESTIFPLEIAHEHRNYLATLGIFLALVVHGESIMARGRLAKFRAPLAAMVICVLALATIVRANTWADSFVRAEYDALHHPLSSRSMYEVGRVRLERAALLHDMRLQSSGFQALKIASDLSPRSPMPIVALINALSTIDQNKHIAVLFDRAANLQSPAREDVFRDIVWCQAYGGCSPRPDLVFKLAERILPHAAPPSADDRRVVEWLAIYYLRVLGDTEAGIKLLQEIQQEAPADLGLALRLAEAQADSGQTEEAYKTSSAIADALPWHASISQRPFWQRVQRLRKIRS